MVENLKIMSLNCRGLRDNSKRKDVFKYLRERNYSICCLQDTHLTDEDYRYIRSQWGFEVFLSPGNRDSRGVAILFRNNFEYKVIKEKKDTTGNMLILDIQIKEFIITLVCIYGPNTDSPNFYSELSQIISNSANDFTIICGDFNLVQDQCLDLYNYKNLNNPKARNEVLKLKEINELQDPWRIYNPEKLYYTWFKKSPIKKARLDFFLISQELLALVDKTDIKPGYRTDHSIIELELTFSEFDKGKGFWKFNNNLLRDKEYLDKVKLIIQNVIEKYSLPVYNLEKIKEIPKNDIQFTINDQMILEQILLEIRGMTIPYSAKKKKENKLKEEKLLKQISVLETITQQSNSSVLMEMLDEYKKELENLRNELMKGILIRSKARWIEHGEKPTRYFCGLEKRNYVNKTVSKVKTNTGQTITDQSNILGEISNFYQNLYSNKDDYLDEVDLDNLLKDYSVPKLSKKNAELLEGKITYKELTSAMKSMKNNKSPGTDGFSVEFFKVFWLNLGHHLLRSVNYSFEVGELSITQKQGVITILPKGNKPREFLKNWRPISLLNVTYKVLALCLANRIKKVLDLLIHENQKGFISGRYIGENTRTLYDILNYTENNSIPGILLLVDFEKAFDSISWNFMFKVLRYFSFGPDILKWIHILYKDSQFCVIQNGIFSRFFNIGRGCRQGDPISPYLFILCVEILGILFRNNKDIKGIRVGNYEYKIFQYADDTGFTLDGSEESLKNTLNILGQFFKYSGLKPNLEKTKAIWIGSMKGSNLRLCKEKKICWSQEPFTVLGITFSTNLIEMLDLNYAQKFTTIQNDILQWQKRRLSALGKITVIKTILIPKLVHLFISLPKPSDLYIKELEKMLFQYIWNKNDRVSRNLLVQDYKKGGCRMVHLRSYIKSLQLTWVRRLINTSAAWKYIVHNECKTDDVKLVCLGDTYASMIAKHTSNPFWKEVFNNYGELQKIVFNSFNEQSEIYNFPIWHNSCIKLDGSSVFFRKWYEKGISIISHLMNSDGQYMGYEEFCNIYDFKPPVTQYYGLRNAIIKSWPFIRNIRILPCRPVIPKLITVLNKNKKGCRDMYDMFLLDIKFTNSYLTKWKADLDIRDNWQTDDIHALVFKCTNDITIRWFQYRIVHRILATNKFLYKIKIATSPLCTFCKMEEETLLHLFVSCDIVHNIWNQLEKWIYEKTGLLLNYSKKEIIFGKKGRQFVAPNMIIFIAKLYIYKQKMRNGSLLLHFIQQEIVNYYNLEKYIFCKEGKFTKFSDRWKSLEKLF